MSKLYSPRVDRRTTLKWLTAGLGTTALAAACGRPEGNLAADLGTPLPVTGSTYGGDPGIMDPAITWKRTMTAEQLRLCASLADIVLPASHDLPAASQVGVPDFLDEFVSSPYEMTQAGRERCFMLFNWLEAEALALNNTSFADLADMQQKNILDRIAWRDRVEDGLDRQAQAFNTFRSLAASAYFTSAAGSAWLGYMGNRPATGDYAGPSDAARAHLAAALTPMGLVIPEDL